MNEENKEYTFTLKGADMSWSGQTEDFVELEDQTDYIFEEDRELVNSYIDALQKRIRELKCEIAHLRGQVETWEKSWRIWNGEEH